MRIGRRRKSKGWLKVCSKSLVFEPHDAFEPLLKFAFRDCTKIADLSRGLRTVPELFGVTCERVYEMRANNVIAPYNIIKVWGVGRPPAEAQRPS